MAQRMFWQPADVKMSVLSRFISLCICPALFWTSALKFKTVEPNVYQGRESRCVWRWTHCGTSGTVGNFNCLSTGPFSPSISPHLRPPRQPTLFNLQCGNAEYDLHPHPYVHGFIRLLRRQDNSNVFFSEFDCLRNKSLMPSVFLVQPSNQG